MPTALVTDAGSKNALCAIRSLAAAGYTVIASAEGRSAPGFYSRFCSRHFCYPSPLQSESFIACILEKIRTHSIDVVIPVGYNTTKAICASQEIVARHAKFAVPSWPSMQIASDKGATMNFATGIGVPIPRTFSRATEVSRFPVVVKRALGQGNVTYVNDDVELAALASEDYVIQEYVHGDGYGFYALFNRGVPKATFAAKRIREYPATGGAATASESVHNEQMAELSIRLLRALDWHGVAMVEWKKDVSDDRFRLMEINPKFWGSLDLSVTCGVNFPVLLAQMALDGDVGPVFEYPSGKRFSWVLDETLRLFSKPSDIAAVARDFLDPSVTTDIRLNDICPHLVASAKLIPNIVRRAFRRQLRYPHGKPCTTNASNSSSVAHIGQSNNTKADHSSAS